MQKKIIVEVSDLADEKEITVAIAKALNKKQLGAPERLQLGTGKDNIEVILPEYEIKVIRKIPDAPEPIKCHCGTEFMPGAGVKYKNNYGGVTKKAEVCSDECFEVLHDVCGDRVAKVGKKLKPFVKPPHSIGKTETVYTKPKDSISVSFESGTPVFKHNGQPYEPTVDDLRIVQYILKLAK